MDRRDCLVGRDVVVASRIVVRRRAVAQVVAATQLPCARPIAETEIPVLPSVRYCMPSDPPGWAALKERLRSPYRPPNGRRASGWVAGCAAPRVELHLSPHDQGPVQVLGRAPPTARSPTRIGAGEQSLGRGSRWLTALILRLERHLRQDLDVEADPGHQRWLLVGAAQLDRDLGPGGAVRLAGQLDPHVSRSSEDRRCPDRPR